MKKRIIVFSVDAMVCEDLARLKEFPNFKKYLAGGCEVTEGMRTIYPSITYPAHTSMATGCYVQKHGVVSNFQLTTSDKDSYWNWFHDAVKIEDIFTAAKKGGYSVASLFWPVTGCHPDIDYLMNECWMDKPGDTLASAFRRHGSSEEMIRIIESNVQYLRGDYALGGKKHFFVWPNVDNFMIHVAADVLRQHKPEVLFLHSGTFDSYRHAYGVFNDHIESALRDLDGYLGVLMDAVRAAGVEKETNLVLVSDHGQRDVSRILNLNVMLRDKGFIDAEDDGTVTDWRAYCLSDAMSSQVYLKDPNDKVLWKEVYDYLNFLRSEGIYGIGRVFTKEEAEREEHLSGEFSFVIETDGYTAFGDAAVRPIVRNFDSSDYRFGRATHGYIPDYGPQPIFVAKGPDFQENTTLERGVIVDEAPTYAKILGVELPNADGKPMSDFLKRT